VEREVERKRGRSIKRRVAVQNWPMVTITLEEANFGGRDELVASAVTMISIDA